MGLTESSEEGTNENKNCKPSTDPEKLREGFQKKGLDGNLWIIVKDRNGDKHWRFYKTIPPRVCPKPEAAKYEIGTIKLGLDGNKWVVTSTLTGKKYWRIHKKINKKK